MSEHSDTSPASDALGFCAGTPSLPAEHRRVYCAHASVREGRHRVLAPVAQAWLVVETSNGYEALEILRRQPIAPAIVDFSMPIMNGLDLVRRIKAEYPQVLALVLSMRRAALRAVQRQTEIADALHLSINTVSTHNTRIQEKRQLPNIAALIRYGQEHDLDKEDSGCINLEPSPPRPASTAE